VTAAPSAPPRTHRRLIRDVVYTRLPDGTAHIDVYFTSAKVRESLEAHAKSKGMRLQAWIRNRLMHGLAARAAKPATPAKAKDAPTAALRPKHLQALETAAAILDVPSQQFVDWYVGDLCSQLVSTGMDCAMAEALENIVYPTEQDKEAARARLAAFLKRKGADERTVAILTKPHPDDVKAA